MKISTIARTGINTEQIAIASKSFAGQIQDARRDPFNGAADHVMTDASADSGAYAR